MERSWARPEGSARRTPLPRQTIAYAAYRVNVAWRGVPQFLAQLSDMFVDGSRGDVTRAIRA
jgi:hypothetical protein